MSIPNATRSAFLRGEINLTSGVVRVLIANNTYPTSATLLSEVPSPARIAISAPLDNPVLVPFSNGVAFDADDRTFPAGPTATATYVALFLDNGVESSSPIISYVNVNQALLGVPYRVIWGSDMYRILYSTGNSSTNTLYNKAREKIFTGQVKPVTDLVKVALVSADYTFNGGTHEFLSDIPAPAVLATAVITDKTIALGGYFRAGNTLVTGGVPSGEVVTQLVVYTDTGNPATSPLLARCGTASVGLPFTGTGNDMAIVWHSTEGVFRF